MIKQTELFPVTAETLFDLKVFVFHFMRRHFKLHVTAGTKINTFAIWSFKHQFFDKSRNVLVGDDLAFPLFYAKSLWFYLDLHVLLDCNLT